ncbi:MAG: sensor histidine kinase [Acidobacteriota bacterium]
MPDLYHAPALTLTVLLIPAFGYLYYRSRDIRTLLWLCGFCCACLEMVLLYTMSARGLSGDVYPSMAAAGQTALLLGTALFLGSLSPLSFRIGRLRILYVIVYTAPLIVYSILLYGVYHGTTPGNPQFLLFPALGLMAYLFALAWSLDAYRIPRWLGVFVCLTIGGLVFWACFVSGAAEALRLIEAANLFMTALLVGFAFRRFSPGGVLGILGFLGWSLMGVRNLPAVTGSPVLELHLVQIIVMSRVVAAIGMILLALEDELAANKSAEERERRARRELEAYSRLVLTRRHLEDFDRQGNEICETVAAHSRFSQAALVVLRAGRYRLAGAAGFDPATTRALEELVDRFPPTGFLISASAPSAVDESPTVVLDLEPWLWPGDDLRRLGLTSVLAVPMINRAVTEGLLMLAGAPASRAVPIRADDLLPIEMLVSRLQATRSHTMMFEKLTNSEKFGHLGQLAATVTQQLNNPLTVILGYASMLDGTAALDQQDRKAVEAILAESRRMRTTLESLSRISRPQPDQLAAVSVAELLTDLGELHRQDFLQRSIEFRLSIAPNLPRALCSPQQLRQAVRHSLQFAMEVVESPDTDPGHPKTIRLEAASEGGLVQIMVAHSGPGFLNPERAFDPHLPPQSGTESAGLNLSLCASILRDNDGRASAVNFEPHGAAIVLELKSA